MYAIVGSRAGLFHKVVPRRQPKDWDIFADENGVDSFLYSRGIKNYRYEETAKGVVIFSEEEIKEIVEVELVEKCENVRNILHRMMETSTSNYASPAWLYFLKMSHRYKKDSPHFWKTRIDIEYMRQRGVGMPENSEELFKERERLTYTNKLPNLNQNSNTFFKKEDGFYVYDHDSIHEAVKILDKPAYQYYMVEGKQVLTSKEKFFTMPEQIRLLGVYEESCVLALERSLIPFDFKPKPEDAFKMAISKVCTSITGGYFREYGWENIFKVMELYKKIGTNRYVEKFKEGLAQGIVLPFNREV